MAELEGACQLAHAVSWHGGSTEMSLSNYTSTRSFISYNCASS